MIQCEFCKKEYSEDRIRSHVIGVHGVYVPKTIFTFSQNIKQQPNDQNSFDKQKIQEKILEPKKLQHKNISKKCQKNINSVYCKYCKNVGHFVKRCPVLAKQRCQECHVEAKWMNVIIIRGKSLLESRGTTFHPNDSHT